MLDKCMYVGSQRLLTHQRAVKKQSGHPCLAPDAQLSSGFYGVGCGKQARVTWQTRWWLSPRCKAKRF